MVTLKTLPSTQKPNNLKSKAEYLQKKLIFNLFKLETRFALKD